MCRLSVFLCAVVLLSGCGKSPTSGSKDGKGDGGGTPSPREMGKETPQVIKDYVEGSWPGSTFEIVKEQACTYKKKPATAVHVKVKMKGEEMPQDKILLINFEAKVKADTPYDTTKPFEEAVRTFVMQLEM
jgi:hypothetical protein